MGRYRDVAVQMVRAIAMKVLNSPYKICGICIGILVHFVFVLVLFKSDLTDFVRFSSNAFNTGWEASERNLSSPVTAIPINLQNQFVQEPTDGLSDPSLSVDRGLSGLNPKGGGGIDGANDVADDGADSYKVNEAGSSVSGNDTAAAEPFTELSESAQTSQAAALNGHAVVHEVMVASLGSRIKKRIQKNWKMTLDPDEDLRAKLKVYLTATGEVKSIEIVSPSGRLAFDHSAERAILNAAPIWEIGDIQAEVYHENFQYVYLVFDSRRLLGL